MGKKINPQEAARLLQDIADMSGSGMELVNVRHMTDVYSSASILLRGKEIRRISKDPANSQKERNNFFFLRSDDLGDFLQQLRSQVRKGNIAAGMRFQVVILDAGSIPHFTTLDIYVESPEKIHVLFVDSLGEPLSGKYVYGKVKDALGSSLNAFYYFKHDTVNISENEQRLRQIQYAPQSCQILSMDFLNILSKTDPDALYSELRNITQTADHNVRKPFSVPQLENYAQGHDSLVWPLFRGIQSSRVLDQTDEALQKQHVTTKGETIKEAMHRQEGALLADDKSSQDTAKFIDQQKRKRGKDTETNLHVYYKNLRYKNIMKERGSQYETNPEAFATLVNNARGYVEIKNPILFSIKENLLQANNDSIHTFINRLTQALPAVESSKNPTFAGRFLSFNPAKVDYAHFTSACNDFLRMDFDDDIERKFLLYDQLASFTEELRTNDSHKYQTWVNQVTHILSESMLESKAGASDRLHM